MRAALVLIAVIVLFAEPVRSQVMHEVRFEIPPVVEVRETVTAAPGTARFEVASNTGFEILAIGRFDAGDLAAAGFRLALASAGPNAAPAGAPAAEDSPQGVVVYRSPVRTAARPGPQASQALAFTADWSPDRLPGGLRLIAQPLAEARSQSLPPD